MEMYDNISDIFTLLFTNVQIIMVLWFEKLKCISPSNPFKQEYKQYSLNHNDQE